MLAVSLSARRSSLLGPFPSAFQAEKAGIRLAEEGGVEQLMVVCDWLSCSDDRLAGTMEPARPLH
jgi:hypothetical protein